MRSAGVTRSALVCLVLVAFAAPVFGQSTPQGEYGAVAIRARPANAEVRIDGERWVAPESEAPLVVQLAPGRHTIEIRARDSSPYSTVVDVKRGETIPLNVSLPPAAAAPPLALAPPPSSIAQVTSI